MQNNINNNSKYFIVIKFCRKIILLIISAVCLSSGVFITEPVFAIEISILALDANNDQIPPNTPIESQKVRFSIQLDSPVNNITCSIARPDNTSTAMENCRSGTSPISGSKTYDSSTFSKTGLYILKVRAKSLNDTEDKEFNLRVKSSSPGNASQTNTTQQQEKPIIRNNVTCTRNLVACVGTGDVDYINGTMFDDVIYGNQGDDSILGANGSDVITGGANDDSILGANGSDILLGDDGNDRLSGGNDQDVLEGGGGVDTLLGDDGNDRLSGGNDQDVLEGGEGDDTLMGGSGADVIIGGNGNDLIFQGQINTTSKILTDGKMDIIDCGPGDDTVFLSVGDEDKSIQCEHIFTESFSELNWK